MGSLRSVNGDKTLAFDPRYTRNGVVQGSAYFFNMGRLLNVGHGESCTLFEAETDYPLATPRRSTGADTIGNHAGLEMFGESRAVFWILYDQANYIVPHSGEYDYEAHIVCTEIRAKILNILICIAVLRNGTKPVDYIVDMVYACT